jgi:uncharacterized protein (DUF58 family)
VPRGRYAFDAIRLTIEDPFGLARAELVQGEPQALVVYPRLVRLERLFSEGGAYAQDGRRLLLRRPTGFELHSVREHVEGESLRQVHWPSTARMGRLMVKELEDAPRDEVAVVLDAQEGFAAGSGLDTSFDVQVRAAGSILWTHARRGRHARLLVTSGSASEIVTIRSYERDWPRALEALAAAEQTGRRAVEGYLAEEAGPAARASDLVLVTPALRPTLVESLITRAVSRQQVSVVYVDLPSFGRNGRSTEIDAAVLRLEAAGIPVARLRRGDDLAAVLGASLEGAALA